MGMMANVRVNTTQRMVFYRGFLIQEAYDAKSGKDVWEWTHENYDRVSFHASGDCQTLFEAIEAVDDWHERAVDYWYSRAVASVNSDKRG